LTKPRIVGLVVATAAAGFYLAAPSGVDVGLFVHTVLGTTLVAGGTNALNQVAERDLDALMRRTANRPIPSGRLSPGLAAAFAWLLGSAGIAYLAALVNTTTAVVAAMTLLSYVFCYTPLKRRTTLATLIGGIPGALPIVGGWTAAGGRLEPEAWVLFWILFLWQLPHFLALAWMYREDYARAGMRMLSVDDQTGTSTFRQAALYAGALLPVSLAPTLFGTTGPWYFFGAMAISGWFLLVSLRGVTARTLPAARRLFLTSVWYLPALLLLMVVDKTG
jgi:protoheme IX farnesyltransferase